MRFFPLLAGFWWISGCPGGARISTKPEKSMPEKSEKNEERKNGIWRGGAECAERMGRIIGGGKKPKKPGNSEGKIQEAKRLRPDLGRHWIAVQDADPVGRRIASRIPPGQVKGLTKSRGPAAELPDWSPEPKAKDVKDQRDPSALLLKKGDASHPKK